MTRCITVLLENEAVREENNFGVHPLNFAVQSNQQEIVKLLLGCGSKIVENMSGYPLNIAVDNKELVKLLLANGSKVKEGKSG